ncbi:MAG: carboxypeptidase-like regulatory domain-containing protein [Candidatus Acidiferrum sp.]
MSSKRVALLLAALFCILAVAPSALFAQSASTGSVAGTVTDPQGAAVATAAVTLTDKSTGIGRTATTNDNGHYIFVDVNPGTYNISVSKTGFRVSKIVDQVVQVGLSLTLNVTMEIGSVAETVEVTATSGAELQTLNATVGNTIGGETLQQLPTIQRDAATFVTLQPGVSPDGSVAGAVTDQSTFMLDGGQNSNDMDGSMAVYTPSFAGDPTGGIVSNSISGSPTGVMPTPIDSVEEYKVNTANQTADFNSSAGAEVQVVTKRGTNTWHGTAYEYYYNNNFNANTWDNNASGTPLPVFHYNRFGAAGGGPVISKNFLGGKTYFFGNYEGFRWNDSATGTWIVPSAQMRQGILEFNGVTYNLGNPATATPTGSNCGSGTTLCDPRQLGLDPDIAALWAKTPMPTAPNSTNPCLSFSGSQYCDGVNEQAFRANYSLPYSSNFAVARLDHDFGAKWHFNTSYRYYKLTRTTSSQVDIGGALPGDTLGNPVALSERPQQPWYYVAGLTTNVTSNTTNDLHYSFLRNYWSWSDPGGIPQETGLGGALEPFGESCACMGPYNVNTQSVRTRFWDGHDNFLRDDWTMLKGNHLFTFGGAYQRNWDWHQRSDNGGGINYQPTYLLGNGAGSGLVDFSSTQPTGVNTVQWERDSAAVLGIITQSQTVYTRSGSDLTLNPPLTHAYDQSTIPYYNVYFSDSWHVKPSITFTYGLGWTLEMPPTEAAGKQIELVDAGGQQLDVEAYLKQREDAALQGQVYNPNVGFDLVGNTGSGQKYPYDPFYGSFSPRVALAWSPNYSDGLMGSVFGSNKTVVRGGYSRVYGRLNGVDLVLVPLLGTGLIQAVECSQPLMTGVCGPTNPTVANGFRIGTDGNSAPLPAPSATLPQPTFPGVNNVSAATGEALDPHFRPNVVDSFDLTIQRQITPKLLLEVGYIGRRITHEYQPININAVPYMMTLGGQQFSKAYAAVETQLGCTVSYANCGAAIPSGAANQLAYANGFTPQPFFENALKGTGYCAGFNSCTAAVVYNEAIGTGNLLTQSVWSLWSDLDNGGFNFPRSMLNTPIVGGPADCNGLPCGANGQISSGVAVNASVGHGNYNGGFVSLKANSWHHITLTENFTYSKALGTGAVVQASSEYTTNDPFNLNNMYGVQNFNRKFVDNVYALIDDPWYKSQQGFVGRVLGGWSLAPIFAIGSGAPVYCNTWTDAQSFGAGDGANFFDNEQCIFTGQHPYGSGHYTSGNANCGAGCFNIFSNPVALLSTVRNPILGLDTGTGGNGSVIVGQYYWNMDIRLVKSIRLLERYNLQFEYTVTNVFNHPVFYDPSLNPSGGVGQFGQVSAEGNNPRAMQFGLRFQF